MKRSPMLFLAMLCLVGCSGGVVVIGTGEPVPDAATDLPSGQDSSADQQQDPDAGDEPDAEQGCETPCATHPGCC
jgi:hypothetical protein